MLRMVCQVYLARMHVMWQRSEGHVSEVIRGWLQYRSAHWVVGCVHAYCHELISPFYYISSPPLDSILILSSHPLSQLWSCFYCVVGSDSQAIFVVLLFHSAFVRYLMGIFLKYWASSCNSLAHVSLVTPLCHWAAWAFQSSPLLGLATSLGPFECPPRPPVYLAFSWWTSLP